MGELSADADTHTHTGPRRRDKVIRNEHKAIIAAQRAEKLLFSVSCHKPSEGAEKNRWR